MNQKYKDYIVAFFVSGLIGISGIVIRNIVNNQVEKIESKK